MTSEEHNVATGILQYLERIAIAMEQIRDVAVENQLRAASMLDKAEAALDAQKAALEKL